MYCNKRPSWQGQVDVPPLTPSPLDSGETTELDDGQGNGSGVIAVSQPTWPIETDLVYVTGTNRIKLSLQRPLLQSIFHDAFENVRCALLFDYAFPDAVAIPRILRGCVVDAAESNTFVDGRHNELAACVHQRLLSDDVYEAKMIRLVSITLHYGWHN